MKIQFPATIEKAETRSDRTLKLTLGTAKELGNDTATVFSLVHSEGWFVYSSNDDITEADVPTEKAESGTHAKSSSQRLRAVIFVYWQQNGKSGNFEDYYRTQMEKLIEGVKEKLT